MERDPLSKPFFALVGGEPGGDGNGVTWFDPSEHARGPWDPDACHAGPPSGLLARASELAVTDQQLVRLTVELIRPIPHRRFGIRTAVTRRGRSVSTTEMTIVAADGAPVITARGMHLATIEPDSESVSFPTAHTDPPNFDEATPGAFPIVRSAHGLLAFADALEIRYPPEQTIEPGPVTLWMRTPPLLDGESGTGFQRIAPLADCGNGISGNAGTGEFVYMNTDLTISIHRQPEGEWFASSAVSRWEQNGVGLADAVLFDRLGPVGRATQSLLVRPR